MNRKNVLSHRRRPVASRFHTASSARRRARGISEDAESGPALPRRRDLPQPCDDLRPLRPGPRQPVDRPLSDEPSRRAEHGAARQRHFNLAKALRSIGYDPALIGYTTTVPDPRTTSPNDPRFSALGDMMDGFRPVGAFEPNMEGYFGWVAQQGFELPEHRARYLAAGRRGCGAGATDRPSRIPHEFSDSTFFTERALTYLKGRDGKPFFLHLGYYRPHPPFVASAPYHEMYRPEDMPAPVRAASPDAESAQHPADEILSRQHPPRLFLPGRRRLGRDAGRGGHPPDARDLLRPDHRGRRLSRPGLRLSRSRPASGTTR